MAENIPGSGAAVVAVGSAAGGWRVVAVSESGLVVVEEAGPAETTAVSPARGPRVNELSGKVGGMSVWRVSQASEAEPGFLEIGDAS